MRGASVLPDFEDSSERHFFALQCSVPREFSRLVRSSTFLWELSIVGFELQSLPEFGERVVELAVNIRQRVRKVLV